MEKLFTLIFFVFLATLTQCNGKKLTDMDQVVQVCGSRLQEMVSFICAGRYARNKKSTRIFGGLVRSPMMLDGIDGHECKSLKMLEEFNNLNEDIAASGAWNNAYNDENNRDVTGNAENMPYFRVRRQIVSECCRKKCSLRNITSYCAWE